jgi:2'-5' RNA ligase
MLRFFESKSSDYASIQFKIVGSEDWFSKIQLRIPEEALFQEYGREVNPHVTILYGLRNDVTVAQIRDVLKNFELLKTIEVFGCSLFDSSSSYDVLKMDVVGPKTLWDINSLLKIFPLPGETFPDYKPHVTLAYLKKGWRISRKFQWISPIKFNGFIELSSGGTKSKI